MREWSVKKQTGRKGKGKKLKEKRKKGKKLKEWPGKS